MNTLLWMNGEAALAVVAGMAIVLYKIWPWLVGALVVWLAFYLGRHKIEVRITRRENGFIQQKTDNNSRINFDGVNRVNGSNRFRRPK